MAGLMSQACERCWRRKQKCSREVPTCHQCCAASVRCVQRGFGSATSPSEIVNEASIGALQRRVQNMRSRLQNGGSEDSPVIETPLSSTASADRVAQDDMAYLSLSAMAERTDRVPSPMGGLSFLTLLYAATGVSGANPTLPLGKNMAISGPLAELRQNHSLSVDLSGADMRAAFELYVNMLQTVFPFVAKKELLEQYNAVAHASEAFGCPEKHALVYLGTATGILLGTHYTYKEMYSTELAINAIGLMSQVLDRSRPLSVVHCLTALTVHSLYTPLGGSTWHLLGLTLTRCVSAGMHTSHLSDPHSESEEQCQGNRTLWTLYVLDTCVIQSLGERSPLTLRRIVSATLDRPFGLDRRDILVSVMGAFYVRSLLLNLSQIPSSPSSRGTGHDGEDTTLRYMIQYAQMLRSIRSDEDREAGILCHFINIRHWKESIPQRNSSTNSNSCHIALSARAYVELLKQPSWLGDPDRSTIIDEVFEDFFNYIDAVEEKLVSSAGAVASIDALLLFSIGVIIAGTMQGRPDNVSKLSKVSNALTLLSLRYPAMISLRDIILELQQCALPTHPRDRLRMLVASSDIGISEQLQLLIFDQSSNQGPLDQQVWP